MRILLPVLLALICSPALATEEKPAPAASAVVKDKAIKAPIARCAGQENASINVSFNSREKSIREAKANFENQMQNIEAVAQKAGAKKFTLTNMNYNINAQPQYGNNGMVVGVTDFQLSGNISYQLDSADAAVAVMESLTKQNMQASMSVNSYNAQCGIERGVD